MKPTGESCTTVVVTALAVLVLAGPAAAQNWCHWSGQVTLSPGLTGDTAGNNTLSGTGSIQCQDGVSASKVPVAGAVSGTCLTTTFMGIIDEEGTSAFADAEFSGTSAAVFLIGELEGSNMVGEFHLPEAPDGVPCATTPVTVADYNIFILTP